MKSYSYQVKVTMTSMCPIFLNIRHFVLESQSDSTWDSKCHKSFIIIWSFTIPSKLWLCSFHHRNVVTTSQWLAVELKYIFICNRGKKTQIIMKKIVLWKWFLVLFCYFAFSFILKLFYSYCFILPTLCFKYWQPTF